MKISFSLLAVQFLNLSPSSAFTSINVAFSNKLRNNLEPFVSDKTWCGTCVIRQSGIQQSQSAVISKLQSSSLNEFQNENRNGVISAAATTRRDWMKLVTCTGATAGLSTFGGARPAIAVVAVDDPAETATQRSALCDPSVSSWKKGNRVVHILGTAHISADSAQLAGRLVREIRPDSVYVELDQKRVGRALPPSHSSGENKLAPASASSGDNDTAAQEKPKEEELLTPLARSGPVASAKINPFDIKGKILRATSAKVGNMIRGLYKKLENEGFATGEEFVQAVREGLKVDATIVLGDRDVDVTLQRLTAALAKTDLKKLLSADMEMEQSLQADLPDSVKEWQNSGSTEIDAKQLSILVETLKTKENVKKVMASFKEAAPEVYQAMVAERDVYMGTGIDTLNQFQTMVAVMGIAHLDGVERYLQGAGWSPVSSKCEK
eukprot:CAMPEP_0195530506 /NCGR_PEP_ID=MMETSP0794_2-20130614/33421_1 /TAXON_ID=515487 /ORGANISM="Stephanopyxis turris, Strain CCMP 815" /LENGTH=436 /DNA_ID=CAMNT_0040662039 /DNA_START=32 /DNA_END=1342 /DNA_ORIENTATION=+